MLHQRDNNNDNH